MSDKLPLVEVVLKCPMDGRIEGPPIAAWLEVDGVRIDAPIIDVRRHFGGDTPRTILETYWPVRVVREAE